MQSITGLTQISITTYHPQGPKGDMLKYQSSLPKLPVPPLHQSLQKYLKAVQPLVNDEEFENTSKAIQEFGKENGVGKELQKVLEERAKAHDNWVTYFSVFLQIHFLNCACMSVCVCIYLWETMFWTQKQQSIIHNFFTN